MTFRSSQRVLKYTLGLFGFCLYDIGLSAAAELERQSNQRLAFDQAIEMAVAASH